MAGQQLLVASLGCALGGGCALIDGVAQARLVLHVYNALLSIGVLAAPIELFETLIEGLSAPEANALWACGSGAGVWVRDVSDVRRAASGRPRANFAASFLLALGVSAADLNSDASVADPRIKPALLHAVVPEEVSVGFRGVVAMHGLDLAGGRGTAAAGRVPALLAASRGALKTDGLVGVNLVAVGALLIRLIDDVVAAAGWEAAVEKEVAKAAARIEKERESAAAMGSAEPPAAESIENLRRAAANKRFLALLEMCDAAAKPDLETAVPASESSPLAKVAKALVDGVKAVRPADYRVVG